MKFYNLILIAGFLFMSGFLSGQERTHNLGLRLAGLSDFDFIYKKSNDGVKFKRYRLAVANIGASIVEETRFNFNVAYAQGIEKRLSITNKILFIHGFEPGLSLGLITYDQSYSVNTSIFLGYVLGFQYNISSQFYINIETIPTITLGYDTNDSGGDLIYINTGFNSNNVALTLAYVFNTTKKTEKI